MALNAVVQNCFPGRGVVMKRRGALAMTLGALVAITGFMGLGVMATRAAVELPVRAIKITFSRSAREEFVGQIKKFSDEHAFEIRVSQSTPDPEDTLVQMWRADAKMLAVHVRDASTQELRYDVGIYTNGEQPLSMAAMDQLVDGLRLSVKFIPSATFTIMK
jgi:D-arabinose 1-dehydrogenase-like Zn-dependent alcohol dehydrogenase